MDRSLAHELPKNQVNFIKSICLPCYSLIVRVLPETMPMLDGAKYVDRLAVLSSTIVLRLSRSNLQRWQELADEEQLIHPPSTSVDLNSNEMANP